MGDFEPTGTNLMTGHEYGSTADLNASFKRELGRLAGTQQAAQSTPPSPNLGRPLSKSATGIIQEKMQDRSSFTENLNQQGEQS